MTAIVLCPGPSLASAVIPACDLTIAVNRAACRFGCDVWAALDWPLIEQQAANVIGCPALLTSHNSLASLRRHDRPWRGETIAVEDWWSAIKAPHGWSIYSMTTAIGYAAAMGHKSIAVYGCDWSGTLDYDGIEAGNNRTDRRWEGEQVIYGELTGWLAGQGVTVERKCADGATIQLCG